jgi:TolB-like protein
MHKVQLGEALGTVLMPTEARKPNATSIPQARYYLSPRVVSAAGSAMACIIILVFFTSGTAGRQTAHIAPMDAIAVVPFDDLSGEGRGSSFARQLTQEVITRLAAIAPIRVPLPGTARHDVRNSALEQLAATLNAQAVIPGTVWFSGKEVRVSIRAIDPRRHVTLWAETYREKDTHLLILPDDLAGKIAQDLLLFMFSNKVSPASQMPNGTSSQAGFKN